MDNLLLSPEEVIQIRKTTVLPSTSPYADTLEFAKNIQYALLANLDSIVKNAETAKKILDDFDSKIEEYLKEDDPKPVMLDGELENFTIKINGKPFRCSCGSNVFNKPDDTDLGLYQCNGCDENYRSE